MSLGRAGVLMALVAASVGQAGQPASRAGARRPPVVISAETGLVFHLSEGAEVTERRASPAPASPLDAEATQRVLDRLPPLPPLAGDQQPFAFRERSLPPPRAGATVVQQLPPPSPPPSGPPAVAGEPVTVVRRSPEGRVPLASHLSITFSQPMVPVGSHDDLAAKGVPVRLTPEPPGKWRWVGTRTLLFEPTGRFPMATTYRVEVPAGRPAGIGRAQPPAGAVGVHDARAHLDREASGRNARAPRRGDARGVRPAHRPPGRAGPHPGDRGAGRARGAAGHGGRGAGGGRPAPDDGTGRRWPVGGLPHPRAAAAGHRGDGGRGRGHTFGRRPPHHGRGAGVGFPHLRPAAGHRAPLRLAEGPVPARRAVADRASATRSMPLRSTRPWCAWSRRCPDSRSPFTGR